MGRYAHDWGAILRQLEELLVGADEAGLDGLTWVRVAKELGISRTTLTGWLHAHDEPGIAGARTPRALAAYFAGKTAAETLAAMKTSEELKIRHLMGEIDQLRREIESRKWFRDMVLAAAAAAPPIKVPKFQVPTGKRKNARVAILGIGDIHWGARVEPAEILRLPGIALPGEEPAPLLDILRYGPVVTKARVETTFRIWLDIVSDVRQAAPVTEGIVLATGDMVDHSGLRQGQERHLADPNVISQSLDCYRTLLECLSMAAEHFERLRFIGVPGNHARVIPKWGVSGPRENFDYLIYALLEASFRDAENVSVDLPTNWFQNFEILPGWRALLFHGDEVRRYLQFPRYGASRAVSGYQSMMHWALRRIMGQLPPKQEMTVAEFQSLVPLFELAVFGHFHTTESWMQGAVNVLSVGSLMAASEFGTRKFHELVTPSQTCGFLHPEWGLQSVSQIHPV